MEFAEMPLHDLWAPVECIFTLCLSSGKLSAIRRAIELEGQFEGRKFRMQDIPAQNPATYDMLSKPARK